MRYTEFIDEKRHEGARHGFDVTSLPEYLYDFQRMLVEWAINKGRAALFADCGLGKTPMQLVWAENIAKNTGGRVLILTPLAVSYQTAREAEKFSIDATLSRDGKIGSAVVITNYERLHQFDATDFRGVVCDESSILKNYDGKRRSEITNFMRKMPYRLLATATAAPNDYFELGTSSEALGELGYMDVLNRFFKNDQNNSSTRRYHGQAMKWRFKGHAEIPFWRWLASWARALRKPSDFGFTDGAFILPPLVEREHLVNARTLRDGCLFAYPAVGLREQREEHRRTITERCEKVAELVEEWDDRQSLVWCHLNNEGDTLEKMMPGSVQISGSDTEDKKEKCLLDFANGSIKVLITKPRIGAWGMNFQGCSHVTFFPSHSFEQYYQGVRRCWRFGQKNEVVVDIITTEGDRGILENLKRKADAADNMFVSLVNHMNDAMNIKPPDNFTVRPEVPSWL